MEEKLNNLYNIYNNWYEANNEDSDMHIVFKRANNKYAVKLNSLDYQNNFNYHNILPSYQTKDEIELEDYFNMIGEFINAFLCDNYFLQDCQIFEYRNNNKSRLILKLNEQKDNKNYYSIFEFVDSCENNSILKTYLEQVIASYDYQEAHRMYNILNKLDIESLVNCLDKDDVVEAVIRKNLKK